MKKTVWRFACPLQAGAVVPFYERGRVQAGESAAIVGYLAGCHGGELMPMPAPATEERSFRWTRRFSS